MTEPKIAVVLNPAAGRGKAVSLRPRIVAAMEQLGMPVLVRETAGPSDATTSRRDTGRGGRRHRRRRRRRWDDQ